MRVVFVLLSFIFAASNGAKILGVFPMPTHSHYTLGHVLFKELVNRGHDVTVITPYSDPKMIGPNFKEVLLDGIHEKMQAFQKNINMFEMQYMPFYKQAIVMSKMGFLLVEETFAHANVQKLINSKESFDLIIMEQFVNDGLRVFQHHYKAPCIIFTSNAANFWVNHLVGNPTFPQYIPEHVIQHVGPMNFYLRTKNLMVNLYQDLHSYWYDKPGHNEIMHRFFPNAPILNNLLKDTALVLVNSHVSMSEPRPLLPNMIEIGGYHVPPVKPLSEDLKIFMDEAEEGVVVFSMGSNLKSSNLPAERRNAILNVFAQLKLKVLWKWEDDVLPGQPKNVKLNKWLPLSDVLAHPNVRLFITHGGLLSTTEAIHHGVPVIGFPIYGDQHSNMALTEQSGCGLSLPFEQLTEKSLATVINEVLYKPRYKENAKYRQRLMHDQPIRPLDTAMFWIEYVIRHNGARHFSSGALHLRWFEYYYIDLFVAVLVSIWLLRGLYFKMFKLINNSYVSRRQNRKRHKMN